MPNYQEMYFRLFNAVTDALEQLEQRNYGLAAELLKAAQLAGEDAYIQDPELSAGAD